MLLLTGVTTKVAVACPAGITTVVCAVAIPSLLVLSLTVRAWFVTTWRRTSKVIPVPFSYIDVEAGSIVSTGRSSSMTVSGAEPVANELADARTETDSFFSGISSLTTEIVKLAEVWPAGITTLIGSESCGFCGYKLVNESDTVSGVVAAVFRVTVPVTVSPSVAWLVLRLTDRLGESSSVMVTRVVPAVTPVAEAVKVAVRVPSTIALSIAPTVNVAELWPARIVTEPGMVRSLGSPFPKVTTRAPEVSPTRVTVPRAAEAPAASLKPVGLSERRRNETIVVAWVATVVLLPSREPVASYSLIVLPMSVRITSQRLPTRFPGKVTASERGRVPPAARVPA